MSTDWSRYIYRSVDPDYREMCEMAEAAFWTVQEIHMGTDVVDWREKLTEAERNFIRTVLAFFAAADGIVTENLELNFMGEVNDSDARAFYAFQAAMEQIHARTYSMLIETLMEKREEQDRVFGMVTTSPAILAKSEWVKGFMDKEKYSFGDRLAAFAVVEGIFFSSSFCAIFWLKRKGVMPGLTFSNEKISTDEGLHTRFACLVLKKIPDPPSPSRMKEIILAGVELEERFVREALPVGLLGMNQDLMCRYVRFVANHVGRMMGVGKDVFPGTENPFDFMNMISIDGKTNFFERRVGEYAKAGGGEGEGGFDGDVEF